MNLKYTMKRRQDFVIRSDIFNRLPRKITEIVSEILVNPMHPHDNMQNLNALYIYDIFNLQ